MPVELFPGFHCIYSEGAGKIESTPSYSGSQSLFSIFVLTVFKGTARNYNTNLYSFVFSELFYESHMISTEYDEQNLHNLHS